MDQVINYTKIDSHSGKGMSFYTRRFGCTKFAKVMEQKEANQTEEEKIELIQSYMEEDDGKNVGSMGHVLLEHFFNKLLADNVQKCFKWTHPVNDDNWTEAIRLFNWFKEHVNNNPNIFGEILGVEHFLKADEKFCSEYGIGEFTARLDLVVRISEQDIVNIKKTFQSYKGKKNPELINELFFDETLLVPGVYIIDHKFYKSEQTTAPFITENSLQAIAYQLLYESLTGERVNGMIQNTIIKTKEPKCRLYLTPPPGIDQVERLKQVFNYARTVEMGKANGNCVDWMGKKCPLFQYGCDGYGDI